MRQPFISVVMPTYNRAGYLPHSIQSVLDQTFGDLELVISNGGSSDNTRDVVAGFDDSRIKYHESEQRLSIGDNYQNGYEKARGEFITFLSDDDAVSPTTYEDVIGIINREAASIVSFKSSFYLETRGVPDVSPNPRLSIPASTGEATRFSPQDSVLSLFREYGLRRWEPRQRFIAPYLANALYHHSIFERIRKVQPRMFAATPADMYLAAAVFFSVDAYWCFDKPLHVWREWEGTSTASSEKKGRELREHYEKLLNGETLEQVPLKFALPNNCTMNAMLQAAQDFVPEDIEELVDWQAYYERMFQYLNSLRDEGVDVSRELEEYDRILSVQPEPLQSRVKTAIENHRSSIKQVLREKIPGLSTLWQKLSRRNRTEPAPLVIEGSAAGFGNILEAARFLSRAPYQSPRE